MLEFYLKKNVQLIPYISGWYAWSHLIPPHTLAANIVEKQIKILESFISQPYLHEEAIQSKGLVGGAFVNIPAAKVDLIHNVLKSLRNDQSDLIEFWIEAKKFLIFLKNEATGASLDEFYCLLPDMLKGIVELSYNMNNSPEVRFIEPMIYAKYYNDKNQMICLSLSENDDRPFCFGTPYVSNKNSIALKIPFSSPLVDEIAKMKEVAGNVDSLAKKLGITQEQMSLFKSFFVSEYVLSANRNYYGKDIRVRYFGHACVLLQLSGLNILIDPAFGYSHNNDEIPRFSLEDLPDKIDYVLITHNHQDHFLFESLLQIRHKICNLIVPSSNKGFLADPSIKLILKHIGFKNVLLAEEFELIATGNSFYPSSILPLPFHGEHGDLNIHSKRAYLINILERKLLFLADSNNLDNHLYQYIQEKYGSIDILFIGMECVGAPVSWLYGPLFPEPLQRKHDISRRLSGSNAEKAWNIVSALSPKEVYVYAMGMEPWLNYIMAVNYTETSLPIVESDKLLRRCRDSGIKSERLNGRKEWFYEKG